MRQANPEPEGALRSLRVVEMGQLIAGLFCGWLTAGFGAEAIMLEPPGKGDLMRGWEHEKPQDVSPWWSVIGRTQPHAA